MLTTTLSSTCKTSGEALSMWEKEKPQEALYLKNSLKD
jgi:hypothetical protein